MSTEQRGIGSVEVGGQLLRVLTEADGPMMLRDLAASAGMTAAKAHPYMVSYMRLGLIEQDRASGRYELGPLALQMGLASMRRLNPVRVATEAIAELVLRINQTVSLIGMGQSWSDGCPDRGRHRRRARQHARRQHHVSARHGDRSCLRSVPSAEDD